MEEAFIVAQIGDKQMEQICDEVIVPAIRAADLIPRRVDRDTAGELLKAEIIAFLERSQIIIADLTNERPNCYLEVGYAMGLGRKSHLILMVREDHHHTSPNYRADGPHVHFDLEGYDLLFWDPQNLDDARTKLTDRIKRRLAVVAPATVLEPTLRPLVVDREWVERSRLKALVGIETTGRSGYMEAIAALQPKGRWRQQTLLQSVREAQMNASGWPIGIVLDRAGVSPYPTDDGIEAEVAIVSEGPGVLFPKRSYDYWNLRLGGDFYILQSLFEDERSQDVIFFDTRIERTTEFLLFLSRVYARLDVPDSTRLMVTVGYQGLKSRRLGAANPLRLMPQPRVTNADVSHASIECTVAELQTKLIDLVRALLEPVFVLFDFFEPADGVWKQIVDNFVSGRGY